MNKIKQLSPQEAQKIAAGEVVERPSSVCKELIENSLDAGATQITLELQKAGKELIAVIDNGSGMSPDDAVACFLPHATSKLSSVEELTTINSFGFRGEALAAISSVSLVQLITRLSSLEDSGFATQIDMIDGKIVQSSQVQAPQGTSLRIKNLFYNVPARQKFLKQDETEWNQIVQFFQAISLSHLSVHFKLYKDQSLYLNLPPARDIQDRICQLFDYNFAQNMLPIAATDTSLGLTITGFISNHQMWRYHRGQQFFFVNNRWVKNSELSKAVTKGYANILPEGRFAAVFVFIQVNPHLVDVNVHPRKEEVQFSKPLVIANALQAAIKKTLEQQMPSSLPFASGAQQPASQLDLGTDQPEAFVTEDNRTVTRTPWQPNDDGSFNIPLPKSKSFPSLAEVMAYDLEQGFAKEFVSAPVQTFQTPKTVPVSFDQYQEKQQQQVITPVVEEYKIIGQLLNCYLLLQTAEGLTIVDQHALHERILYHKFLHNFERKEGTRLLFPLLISLQASTINRLLPYSDFFEEHGIAFEAFGGAQIRVVALPPALSQCDIQGLFEELIQFIESSDDAPIDANMSDSFRKKLHEHLHGQMACKAAVKKGDLLTMLQMEQLMQDAQVTPLNYICVHGRPTMWKISQLQLEKQFQRK